MKRFLHVSSIFIAAFLLSACRPTPTISEPVVLADFDSLTAGWNTIEPGGETICSDGSPYKFFVRPGDPEKFMFYLEGGGACWAGVNCDPDIRPSHQVNLSRSDPNRAHGIFAFDQPANPFADYTVVLAPYCSGDVHLGSTQQQYEVPSFDAHTGHELTVHHRGVANANAALDWTYNHLFAPATVFVTGSSAGSIPSPYYAVKLAEHYAQAQVIQLGDASGGYRGFADFSPLEVWDAGVVVNELDYVAGMAPEEFSFHHLYVAAAQANPQITLASFDTVEDSVQKQFLALGGSPTESLQPLLDANLAEISQAVPDFRYFVAGGDMHTILLRPELYSYKADDVRFVDWLSSLAKGEPVANARCADCSAAELAD
jgi:hypothetical protein